MRKRESGSRAGAGRLRVLAAAMAVVAAVTAAPLRLQADVEPVAVQAVASVGTTVADLARSVRFFVDVLGFEREGEVVELAGRPYELLHGVFGARLRVARLRLGREHLELTEYAAPAGRAYPEDTRGNDRWFQHIAIITSDMDAAYARLREHGVAHASTGPQRLNDPRWTDAKSHKRWLTTAVDGAVSVEFFRDASPSLRSRAWGAATPP